MPFAEIELIPGPSLLLPTLELRCGQEVSFQLVLKNSQGCPIDLTPYINTAYENPPGGACRARHLPMTTGVLLTVRCNYNQDPPALQRECTIIDPVAGIVQIDFLACDFSLPGLYLAEVALINEAKMKDSYRLYIEAAASLTWKEQGYPITIQEVRLWSRDNSPEDNFLLDEVEYKDSEIVAAIRRGVDLWNETPPMMTAFTFTVVTFPYRSAWLDVTLGFLMQIAAQNYMRNALAYQAGGLQIDDKWPKYQAYTREAEMKITKFKEWMLMAKPQLNMDQAFGRLGYYRLY